ncbi:MAG: hypothetical protein KGQ59_11330, partial [Bdellovibrionales bacterium]|nr:hypothetical protein [Bdellovibrionales bacterium]
LDQLARAEMSRMEKARNSPSPTAESKQPVGTPDSFKNDFIALFPELECRNWHITPRKEEGAAAWQQKFHYTLVAKAKKRVTLDGLDYPAQSELFLEGHAEDLYNHGSQKKVFRRIRILPRSP